MAKSPEMEKILEKLTKDLFGEDRTRKPVIREVRGSFVTEHKCPTCGKSINPDNDYRRNAYDGKQNC